MERLFRMLSQFNPASGSQLRHDDPSALKQIIQIVQEKQKGLDADQMR